VRTLPRDRSFFWKICAGMPKKKVKVASTKKDVQEGTTRKIILFVCCCFVCTVLIAVIQGQSLSISYIFSYFLRNNNYSTHSKCEKKAPSKGAKCEKFKPSPEDVSKFRDSLAKLGDIYVCDAFGTAHRAHSSMVGMKGKMPCVSGLLVAKELAAFSKVLDPALKRTPLTSIVGGAKISDKVLVIDNLIDQSDNIIICGGMAYTFLKTCFGMKIGKSLFDAKGAELAPGLLEKAKNKGCQIVLPCDWACGQDFCNDQEIKMVTQEEGIPDGWEGMDCGPKSMEVFRHVVLKSATVIWNGPAGVFEFDNFSKGTKALLEAVAETTAAGNVGIIGGGDSATAAAKWNMEDKVTFVSTGGGASLELLEGKELPGVAALDDK